MTPALTYLLKVVICSGLLTGYYYIALRNRVFHQWNRFYLLVTVVLSLALPLTTFTIFHNSENKGAAIQLLQSISTGDEYVVYVTRNAPFLSLEQGLTLSYGAVSLVLFTILGLSLVKVLQLIKKHSVQQVSDIQFINSDVKGTPFSFFHYIFWNPSIDLQSENGKRIFRHEMVHVRERHSLDKLILQLVLVFCWCNPFFWIIRHELRMVHEFIADRKALDQQDASALAAMILQTAYPTRYNQLINSFFHQSIKRRIHMLAKKTSPRVSYISRILFIPLAACLVLAFSVRTKPVANDNSYNLNSPKANLSSLLLEQEAPAEPLSLKDTLPDKNVNVLTESFNGLVVVNGKEYKQDYKKIPYNTIKSVNVLKGAAAISKYGGKGRNGVIEITLKDVPQEFNGLVMVDGKEYKEDFKKIDPNIIQSVNVLKGAAATTKYGDKGKNGALEITLKGAEKSFNGLVMVDGKEYKEGLDKIDPNTIQSMNVLKDAAATQKYGSKGEQGVIEITLKKPTTQAVKDNGLPVATSEGPTFTKAEVEPQFPGGVPEWRRFLEQNLRAAVPVEKDSPAGTFTVLVQLLVEKDGTISEIKPLTTHGFGMEEEVVRTIKLSPKWEPAKQNGRTVRAYKKQPITFVISEADNTENTTTKQ